MALFESFLEKLPPSFFVGLQGGCQLAVVTLTLTLIFELFSLDTVHKVLQQPGGVSLYLTAVFLNFFNHIVLGIPVYALAVMLYVEQDPDGNVFYDPYAWNHTRPAQVLGISIIQAICYYSAHKLFHSSPALYRFHRFHHRFHRHVPPVATYAVSAVEYLVAYVSSATVAALVLRPNEASLRTAAHLAIVGGLLIHTPKLERISKRLPPCMVSTFYHLEHHRRLTTNYSDPWLNVDWFVKQVDFCRLSRKFPTWSISGSVVLAANGLLLY